MIAFQILSAASAITVLTGLLWFVFRRNEFIIRPSVIFLGFFWLQVQLSSAVNAAYIYMQLVQPWTYFVLVQLFPLALLFTIPFTFRTVTREVNAKVSAWVDDTQLPSLVGRTIILLAAVWSALLVYLHYVPFEQTGLYALLVNPAMADAYRELSMKLADLGWFNYLWSLTEKAVAPLAAASVALLMAYLWRSSRRRYVPIAALGLIAAALPTMIYGARGPAVMVLAGAIFTLIIANKRLLAPLPILGAVVVVLAPAVILMALKSGSFSPNVIVFQFGNVLDRAVGRNYCDNVSHISFVQKRGFHGIAAIEKVAPLFGVKPVDILNQVGEAEYSECRSYGFSFLQFGSDPLAVNPTERDIDRVEASLKELTHSNAAHFGSAAELERRRATLAAELGRLRQKAADEKAALQRERERLGVKLEKTVSAGASFLVLNYAAFGLWTIIPSLLFILGLDGLLLLYRNLPPSAALMAVGAGVIPVSNLTFSFFTTVLASKGLLAVPLLAWLVTRIPESWFSARSTGPARIGASSADSG